MRVTFRCFLSILPFVALVLGIHGAPRAWSQDADRTQKLLATLTELRTQLAWPGTDVATAAQALGNADAAYRFVRDGVVFADYRGAWGGAAGTLRTRAGNPTDQALLLAALLHHLGHATQLVRADWPADAQPARAPGNRRDVPAAGALRQLLGAAPADDVKGPGDAIPAVQREIEASLATLDKTLKAGNRAALLEGTPDPKAVAVARPVRDWIWVRAKIGDAWTDFDPVLPQRPRPEGAQAGFAPKAATVRLELASTDEAGKNHELLTWQGPAHAVLGFDASLRFLPADDKVKSLHDVKDPLAVKQWKPLLQIGPATKIGAPFAPAGAAPAEPAKPAGGGFGGGLFGGRKKKPKPVEAGVVVIRVGVTLTYPTDGASVFHRRELLRLGPTGDTHGLISLHRIGVAATPIPHRMLEARVVDEMIDLVHFRRLADGGKAPAAWSPSRGLSARSARVLDDLALGLVVTAPPGLTLAWSGPAVFVESFRLAKRKDGLYHVGRLDFLKIPWTPGPQTPRRQRAAWGLAVAAIEGQLLRTESVNAALLRHADTLTADTKALPHDPRIVQQTAKAGGLIVRTPNAPQHAWTLAPTGDLHAIALDHGTAAKGASSQSRAEEAADHFGAGAAAAMGTMGHPAGMLVTGLVYYFKELAKAYDKAARKLNQIADAIASGDTSKLEESNDDYFKNLGQKLMNSLTSGLIRGYVESVVSTGISQGLQHAGGVTPGSTTGSIIDGVTGGGVGEYGGPITDFVTPEDVGRIAAALAE
ncbi:MAG: hypothetical protein ACYTEZ_17870 [Planctomycetota bacterium]|jgi:hypothetical protein